MCCSSLPPLFCVFFLMCYFAFSGWGREGGLCVRVPGQQLALCSSSCSVGQRACSSACTYSCSCSPFSAALLRLLPPTLCCLFPAVLQCDGLDISWRLLLCWAAHAFLSVHLLLLLHAMSARPVPLRLLPPSRALFLFFQNILFHIYTLLHNCTFIYHYNIDMHKYI